MAAVFTCSEPMDMVCRCPVPMEPMASFMPLIPPAGSCRGEIMLPAIVSDAMPSVILA